MKVSYSILIAVFTLVSGVSLAGAREAGVATAEPVNVGNKTCPVSGRVIGSSGMAPATLVYKGKVYNFCCGGCLSTFSEDPEKYVKIVEDQLKQEPDAHAAN